MVSLLLVATAYLATLVAAQGNCGYGQVISFVKWASQSPLGGLQSQFMLYSTSPGQAVTAECYNRCRARSDCSGFVVDYARSTCFRVVEQRPQLLYTPQVSFFAKACLPVPANCSTKAWTVDFSPGYELVGLQYTIIPNISDRWSCAGACLAQEACLSANYHETSRTCSLSGSDRWTSPDSFLPTLHPTSDYIENQCPPLKGGVCWRDPLINKTFPRPDLQIFNMSQEQCRTRCGTEGYFRCKGFSWSRDGGRCLLHSDPALSSLGNPLAPPLAPTGPYDGPSQYTEAISCIDLRVTCSTTMLNVTLVGGKFEGRLYVQGHSDTCGVQGRGAPSLTLSLPLPQGVINNCDLTVAKAIADVNRTLVSTVVVVQHHQLIQTVNDRVVRVNCMITESAIPIADNFTLNATFSVNEPSAESEVSGTGGNVLHNGTIPRATMSVIDLRTGKEATDVSLGDPLQLRIQVQPPFNVSTVRVGHMVASSGSRQDSLLLLDWRGCPPDLTVFPAVTPLDSQTLAADFRAFRFPSSPVLVLSIVLTVCPTLCEPSDCGNGVSSFGKRRRKREAEEQGLDEFTEMPLHLAIVVHAPQLANDSTSDILSASFGWSSEGEVEGEVCASFLVASLAALFWLLLQCVLLALCCCVLQKHKDSRTDTISLARDFDRHVSWASDTEVPSRRLRLSTPIQS